MPIYWLQTFSLMAAAYLLAAMLACLARRLVSVSGGGVTDATRAPLDPVETPATIAASARGPMIEAQPRPDPRPSAPVYDRVAPAAERSLTPPPVPVQSSAVPPARPVIAEVAPVVTLPDPPRVVAPVVTLPDPPRVVAPVVTLPDPPRVVAPVVTLPDPPRVVAPVVTLPDPPKVEAVPQSTVLPVWDSAKAAVPAVPASQPPMAVAPVVSMAEAQAVVGPVLPVWDSPNSAAAPALPAYSAPTPATPIVVERLAANTVAPAYSPVAAATAAAAASIAAAAASRVRPQPAATAVVADSPAAAATKPPVFDDLTQIRGIDLDLQSRLRSLGVTSFDTIARLRPVDVSSISSQLGFKGRIERENWIEQAQILAKGVATDYARRQMESLVPLPASPPVPAVEGKVAAPVGEDRDRAPLTAPETPAPAAPVFDAAADQEYNRYETVSRWRRVDITALKSTAEVSGAVPWMPSPASSDAPAIPPVVSSDPLTSRSVAPVLSTLPPRGSGGTATPGTYTSLPSGPAKMPAKEADVSAVAAVVAAATALTASSTTAGAGGGTARASVLDGLRPVAGSGPAGDNLQRISGIGVLNAKKLNALGIVSYAQIANWTDADIERISAALDFQGRIQREQWVQQARILTTGGTTDFAQRMDAGAV